MIAKLFWSICIALVMAGLALGPMLSRWERNQGYPFGQMCKSVFTGGVDTCPRR